MITKVLKFEADWCGPCKVLSKQMIDLPIEVEVINVDSEDERVIDYNIRNVPTLIFVDENENLVHKHIGLTSRDEILKIINNG